MTHPKPEDTMLYEVRARYKAVAAALKPTAQPCRTCAHYRDQWCGEIVATALPHWTGCVRWQQAEVKP